MEGQKKHPIVLINIKQVFYSKDDAIKERAECVEKFSNDYHIGNLYDLGGWTFEMTEKEEWKRRCQEKRRRQRRFRRLSRCHRIYHSR